MGLVNTDAIVLRTYNLAEADRIVLCLTRDAGLVRAVAKGARRMKSRFGAALEPFTFIKLDFYEKENRELVTVSQVEILKSNFDLAAHPDSTNALAYIAELVSEFAPPHEANDKLYRMVKACIDALTSFADRPDMVVRYFEVWLLRLAGLFPDLRDCAECNRRFVDDELVYVDSEARQQCRACSHGMGVVLSSQTRGRLAATQKLAPLEFANSSVELSADAQTELAEFTHRLLVRAMERRPRTVVGVAAR
jgi:DNA repair protein RecO (recombination protein O)